VSRRLQQSGSWPPSSGGLGSPPWACGSILRSIMCRPISRIKLSSSFRVAFWRDSRHRCQFGHP
jgi:hypothetical protein